MGARLGTFGLIKVTTILSRIATANLRNRGTDALISCLQSTSSVSLRSSNPLFSHSCEFRPSGIPGEDGLTPPGDFYLTQQIEGTRRKNLIRYGICLNVGTLIAGDFGPKLAQALEERKIRAVTASGPAARAAKETLR